MANPRQEDNGVLSNNNTSLAESVRDSVRNYLEDLNGEEATRVYQMVMDQVEKPLLEEVMKYSENNQSKASRVLGINRTTLRKKLGNHEIGD